MADDQRGSKFGLRNLIHEDTESGPSNYYPVVGTFDNPASPQPPPLQSPAARSGEGAPLPPPSGHPIPSPTAAYPSRRSEFSSATPSGYYSREPQPYAPGEMPGPDHHYPPYPDHDPYDSRGYDHRSSDHYASHRAPHPAYYDDRAEPPPPADYHRSSYSSHNDPRYANSYYPEDSRPPAPPGHYDAHYGSYSRSHRSSGDGPPFGYFSPEKPPEDYVTEYRAEYAARTPAGGDPDDDYRRARYLASTESSQRYAVARDYRVGSPEPHRSSTASDPIPPPGHKPMAISRLLLNDDGQAERPGYREPSPDYHRYPSSSHDPRHHYSYDSSYPPPDHYEAAAYSAAYSDYHRAPDYHPQDPHFPPPSASEEPAASIPPSDYSRSYGRDPPSPEYDDRHPAAYYHGRESYESAPAPPPHSYEPEHSAYSRGPPAEYYHPEAPHDPPYDEFEPQRGPSPEAYADHLQPADGPHSPPPAEPQTEASVGEIEPPKARAKRGRGGRASTGGRGLSSAASSAAGRRTPGSTRGRKKATPASVPGPTHAAYSADPSYPGSGRSSAGRRILGHTRPESDESSPEMMNIYPDSTIEYMTNWHKKTQRILKTYENNFPRRGLRQIERELRKLEDVYQESPYPYQTYQEMSEPYDVPGGYQDEYTPSGDHYGAPESAPADVPPESYPEREMSAEEGVEDPAHVLHKIWGTLAQKQIPKVYRHLSLNQAVRQQNCRRVAQICQRELRRVATKSAKERKEMQLRSKRAMREMLLFWKRNEKEEKEARKRAEREAQERMRIEEERRESMRQNRKLNFLISQTELFSHFVGNKLGTGDDPGPATTDAAALAEKSTADGAVDFEQIDFDDEDETNLQKRAMQSAQSALALQQRQMKAFDDNRQELRSSALKEAEADHKAGMAVSQDLLDEMNFMNPSSMLGQNEIKQPKLLMCQLKEYQLKGLNWLANLYDQGINGILADEMGLGKTVQSISLLAYLAEVHHIQGPFLVVAPASTLHNWQQEISRFVPAFKILPYWGNVKDRKTLRKLWNKNTLYSSDPPFNVLITSYQMVVTDERYFQRVKWQYMVLDEAQAIKSSSSTRWKILLGFHCRNRLLLTGTPIQNSMQELWALLHFIMPTLFDSHEEFSEWFSKDIESHAENKTSLNQHQLSRLHIILKPFMLRRIKKHVQNELGDKIELEVRCNLTARQRYLYQALKSRISAAELLAKASSSSESDSDSLMNLVMQFRKVCNHPELFERAEVESPYAFCTFSLTPSVAREGDFLTLSYVSRNFIQYHIPRRLYADGGLLGEAGPGSSAGILTKLRSVKLNIWQPDYIQGSIEGNGAFAFAPYVDHSPQELTRAFHNSLWERWVETLPRLHARENWFRYVVDHPELAFHRPRVRLMMPLPGLASPTIADLRSIVATALPYHFLNRTSPAYQPPVVAPPINAVCSSWSFTRRQAHTWFEPHLCRALLEPPCSRWESSPRPNATLPYRRQGLSHIWMPAADKLISYSAKMTVLDKLLAKLKSEGHRVLVYFQMTKMIDLMEEYLTYRQYTYLRLDGSSKISERRDMVTDWQTRDDIFIFLLSTRAGGLGINLTAADTVIFYDSDWNPTVDQQAMDRAHRLGQTRQVTVYRLLTRGTIEEKILMRARQKDEIHKVVISGGDFKQQVDFKPKEIVSLLLDDTDSASNKFFELGDITDVSQYKTEAAPASGSSDAAVGSANEAGKDGGTTGGASPQGDGVHDLTADTAPLPVEVSRKALLTSRMIKPLPSTVATMNHLFDPYLLKPEVSEPATASTPAKGGSGGRASAGSSTRKRATKSKANAGTSGNNTPNKRVRQSKEPAEVVVAATPPPASTLAASEPAVQPPLPPTTPSASTLEPTNPEPPVTSTT